MEIEIRPAMNMHAILLAPKLRKADLKELELSCGLDPLEALTRSIQMSTPNCWTALLDGQPEIMWGAAPSAYSTTAGVAWLLSSDEMYKIPGRFLKESVTYMTKLFEIYDTLFNYVHADNMKSRQWLENMGFNVLARNEEYGVGKVPFLLYSRTI